MILPGLGRQGGRSSGDCPGWFLNPVRPCFQLRMLSKNCPNPNYNYNYYVLQSITTAHRDWICGLALVPRSSSPGGGVLVSACRAGTLRTWSLTNSTFLGETQAHVGPINAICTNSTLVFTASTSVYLRFQSASILLLLCIRFFLLLSCFLLLLL